MPPGQLHYACHFQIRTLKPSFSRGNLLRIVKTWIANRHDLEPEHPLRRSSRFYKGTEQPWPFMPGCSIETDVWQGAGSAENPEYWVLNYQHEDFDRAPLRWRCDVVVRQLPELLDFRFQISYTGDDRGVTPEHRIPWAVQRLLDGQGEWLCYAGADPLSPGPVPLERTGLDIFVARLFAPERRIPFLLITPSAPDEWLVDPWQWAERLAGVAKVWQVADWDTCSLLDKRLPAAYACYPGAIRFYLPGANPERDARPHQYIPANRLWSPHGRQQALKDTARLLARRTWEARASGELQDLDQLRAHAREQELQRHRRELAEATRLAQAQRPLEQDPEYTRLLELEVADLQAQLDAERQKASELQNRAVQLEYLLQDNGQNGLADSLQKLPENLTEMLELIQLLYPQRVAFSDRARKSAKTAAFNQSRRLNDAWRLLWHMANTLYDLYFNSEGVNVEAEFENRSGFGLTLKEGSQTRANRKLMALREDDWNGRAISIEPHAKIGTEAPNLLRVHYASLEHERLLVIGHIGDHMPNHTTLTKF
ncbi:MAG: hypothetical protein U1D69_03345 [Polynucleobacter sp.]|nr:hypothetical protein [Polynucleobacter sp.]